MAQGKDVRAKSSIKSNDKTEMTMSITSIRTDRATKVFGAVRALVNASFEVTSGETVAVMGPNGAGKSTLLSILSLCMRPTRGKVLINRDPVKSAAGVLGRIGILSHQPLIYPDLTGRENLMLFARLYDLEDPAGAAASMEEELALTRFAVDRPTRVLSRGQLQRVALARALVSKPDLLLLDEPAAGLDSDAVLRIEQVLEKHIKRGGMAVVVTHETEVASCVATRAVMMQDGRIVSDTDAPTSVGQWKELYHSAIKRERN